MTDIASSTQLLVVQPTTYCNLDCDYCYLPDRDVRRTMPLEILDRALQNLSESGLLGDELTIVWHAGEPLAVPPDYYADAFRRTQEFADNGTRLVHAIQTNGSLIRDIHCELFSEHRVKVGVSIDGPAWINDEHRRTRRGLGSHMLAMRGVRRLKEHGVKFNCISVLTSDSLDHPDEIYSFFADIGCEQIGFNVEEIEGLNVRSSIEAHDYMTKIKSFYERLLMLSKESEGPIIRELTSMTERIERSTPWKNSENTPFAIVTVDTEGNFSTFSPELHGADLGRGRTHTFGNVATDRVIDTASSPAFDDVSSRIGRGIDRCRRECDHFIVCRGGSPSNKFFETGDFGVSETRHCRATIKTLGDVVLGELESARWVRDSTRR